MPTGRRGRVGGTYEKMVSGLSTIIAYTITPQPAGGEAVTILHVMHGARDWPSGRWPE